MNSETINTSLELKWGTQTPILYKDPTFDMLNFTVKGKCIYNLVYPQDDKTIMEEFLFQNIQSVLPKITSYPIVSNYNDFQEKSVELSQMLENDLKPMVSSYITIESLKIEFIEFTSESIEKIKKGSVTIVDTAAGSTNGQTKCPKCGATDITPVGEGGKLKCNFCRHEFEAEKVAGLDGNIADLKGQVIGSGAQDIDTSFDGVLTLKCSSCGAEVVIDTNEVTNARCHWCRSSLTINQQIPNGSVPDVVLPFFIKKEDAQKSIEEFVSKRQFFAHPKFKQEFKTDNILGVYFPYMVVDVNAHCKLMGQGEHQTRWYTVKIGDSRRTYYDADAYNIEREFDIEIDDLTIEGSVDKLDKTSSGNTNNVINAIMPFDLMNAVKWDANYLKGFTSEKRDINIDDIKPIAEVQSKDIARFAANESLEFYDRGVCWANEYFDVKGQQWKSAYLPVWLYSYQEVKGDKKILHYVAVNGRTKEVMGSIPINMGKLIGISAIVEIIGIILMLFVEFEYNWIFLSLGIIFFLIIYSKYRNKDARHRHELETNRKIDNLRQVDNFAESRKKLSSPRISGVNNHSVTGVGNTNNVLNKIKNKI